MCLEGLPVGIGRVKGRVAEVRAISSEEVKIKTPATLASAVNHDRGPSLGKGWVVTEALQLSIPKPEHGTYGGVGIVYCGGIDKRLYLRRRLNA